MRECAHAWIKGHTRIFVYLCKFRAKKNKAITSGTLLPQQGGGNGPSVRRQSKLFRRRPSVRRPCVVVVLPEAQEALPAKHEAYRRWPRMMAVSFTV